MLFGVGWFIFSIAMFGLLASCSPAPAAPPPSGTGTGDTKPYGSLTIAGNFSSGTIDPGTNQYGLTATPVLEGLLYLSPDGKMIPLLADRWEISPDGLAHTFYVKKGIKFQDGSDLTGADVKFSFEKMLAPETNWPSGAIWRAAIAAIELKDDYTVVLRMKAPQYDLLSGSGGLAGVLPKKYIEEKGWDYWRKNVIASGPFKISRYESGSRVELEALDAHWRVVPKFKNLTLLNIPEEGTRVAMLKTGELDIGRVSHDSVAGLKAAGLRILAWPGITQFIGYFYFDVLNPEKYAVGDKRVRKALALALNRQEIIDKLYAGLGRPTTVYPVSPDADFFDSSVLKVDPYDPEGAKKLLAEAGYPNGFNTRIYDTMGRGVTMVNQAMTGYWRRIGVNADLVPIEYASWYPKQMPKHDPEIWNSMWTYPATMDLDFRRVISTYHSTKGVPKNHTNLQLDELLDRIPTIANSAERKRLMIEALAMAKNEYSALPLLDIYTVLALGPKVGGMTPYPVSDIEGTMLETITHPK